MSDGKNPSGEHLKNSGDGVFVSGTRVHSDGHRFLGFAAEEPEELKLNQLSIDARQRLHTEIPDLFANEWFGIYTAVKNNSCNNCMGKKV